MSRQGTTTGVQLFVLVLGVVVSSDSPFEQPLGVAHQPASPVLDLIRVHVVLLGQLGEDLLPPNRSHRYLRLERRRLIPALSSHLLVLCPDFSDHDRRHLQNRDSCPTHGVHLYCSTWFRVILPGANGAGRRLRSSRSGTWANER